LKTVLLSPRQNFIETLLPFLRSVGKDYSGNLVVFPGKRPSHFLRKSLSRSIEGSLIPPVILSMDDFINFVFASREDGSRIKLEAIDAVALLYDLHKGSRNPLGGEHFMTPDSFFPVGMKIYRDIEELHIECVPPEKVKEIDALLVEAVPQLSAARLQTLSYFYEEFYKRIESMSLSTRSSRYRTVSEVLSGEDLGQFQQVIFAGFYAFTQSEKVLFRKMSSREDGIFLFQEGPGVRERLSDLGIEAGHSKTEMVNPETYFYRSPDAHGQVFALGNLLKQKLEQGTPLNEKSVIVLPSVETLFPLLQHGLSFLSEEDYNISLGYPLQRTPVYGFLNALMELITSMDGDRFYIPDYVNFILHPYTKNIYCQGSSETTRILFHTMEEKLTGSRTKKFLTLSEIEEQHDLYKEVIERLSGGEIEVTEEILRDHLKAIHRNTIGKFLSLRDVRDFSEKSIDILHYIFSHSTARLHPVFFPFSEAFIQALHHISVSLLKDTRFTDTRSYFSLFRKYLASCYTPFDGTPVRGLQVLGVLETRNLTFDRVFLLDMNEEVIPDTRKEETLLPFRVRQSLGLPTYLDRDKLSAYYFETLWRGAKEVHLFSIENDEKERSRFVERLLWERQKKDRVKESGPYFKSVQYQLNLENRVPGEIGKSGEMVRFLRDHEFSATSLDTYLSCPLQFYYQYVLRIDRREEITEAIERADIGKFVHLVLSRFFEKRKGSLLREKDVDPVEMSRLIDTLFEDEYGKDPVGAAYLLKGQVKAHLEDFLQRYTIPLLKDHPVTVLHVEHSIKIRKNSFVLKGRLDQVEERGKKTFIIDYKTSSHPDYLRIRFDKLDLSRRETWSDAIGSLQLPFYLLLYSEGLRKNVEELDALFLLLGRIFINREIELPCFGEEENRREKFDLMETVIFSLLKEIVDPAFPFRPPPSRKTLCPPCDFKYICGTQWIS